MAYVASQQITDAWAKSGVMFRNDTSAGSAFAAIVATPGNGISFVWRTSAGAQAQQVNTGSPAAPVWLKLVRSDNNFSGYYSTDDVSWIQVGSTQNASIAAPALAGLAVCSHNNGTSSTAAFNNVSVLPAGWSDVDIGSPGLSGEATSDGTTWTITGGGADIYGTSDQFNFVSESVTGDAAAIVNVASLGIPEAWSKAGLMVRNDASAGSAFADVVLTPGNGVAFQWRSSSGAGAQSVNIAGPGAPEWLKMVRSGDNFSAYYSADDVNWTQVGSNQSISIGSTAMIGLAVTSHDNSVFNTASFASLSIDTPPVVSGTSGTALSWTEALPPAAPPVITIAPGLSISDASSPQLTAATVAITSGLSSPEDVLGWDHSLAASDGIGVAYSAADGTLSLSGTASLSQYQIVLQSVTYSDTSQNPSTLQRTINFSVTDANGLLSGVTASSQQVIDVTAVDNPPTVGASAAPTPTRPAIPPCSSTQR